VPVALGLLAAGCREQPAAPPALPALAGISTVLRLPVEGGAALAYRPDSLVPEGWRSANRLPPVDRILGYDPDLQLVYALDTRRRLLALDLASGSFRPYLTGIERATIGPDGAAWAVDSANRLVRLARRAATIFPARFPPEETFLYGAIAGQVVAVRSGTEPRAQLLSLERSGPPIPVGPGPVAVTWWGELLATTTGDEVELYRVSDGTRLRDVGQPDPPSALLFSPSGHRLFALVGDQVTVADRFTGSRLGVVRLPAPAQGLRGDASGRWLIAGTLAGDSVHVVDLATLTYTATLPGAWREDLPLLAGAATLLVTEGDDVVAYDLALSPPTPAGRVTGGAVDRWTTVSWVPPLRERLAMAAAESARAVQDSALLLTDTTAAEASLWLQVSSSQNPEWAQDLARELADAGFEVAVWEPREGEESYRVMVGPFRSREAAEEAGKRLGRPYFVVTPPSGRSPG
jgi:hypothetical protein